MAKKKKSQASIYRRLKRRAKARGLPPPPMPEAVKANQTKAKSRPSYSFYRTAEWARLRYEALVKSNGRCSCCGYGPIDGVILRVDHIKPISRYPHLKADPNNLQVVCNGCNWGKGSWDETDWRYGTMIPSGEGMPK